MSFSSLDSEEVSSKEETLNSEQFVVSSKKETVNSEQFVGEEAGTKSKNYKMSVRLVQNRRVTK